jgi:hypothetical protein
MDDDFYQPLPSVVPHPSGLVTQVLPDLLSSPGTAFVIVLITVLLVAFATRLLTGADSELETVDGKHGRTVWALPYWVPFIGHGYQLQVPQIFIP